MSGILEGVHEPGELFEKVFPSVEVWRDGGAFSLEGCFECRFPGVSYLDLELPPVMGVSCPRDQASRLQTGQHAAQGLALNLDLRGELFLVHGVG